MHFELFFKKYRTLKKLIHAVSHTLQGRQREPSVKALRFEWRNSTPRYASTPERRNEMSTT